MAASAVIAVIDDDDAIRRSVACLIASRGYRTEAYASAEEFIVQISRSEATCLVVDVQLEDLSGVELIRHIFSLGVQLPVVFITGIDDELICRQAAELGCVAYLKKPLCRHLLFEAIAEAIECQTLGRG